MSETTGGGNGGRGHNAHKAIVTVKDHPDEVLASKDSDHQATDGNFYPYGQKTKLELKGYEKPLYIDGSRTENTEANIQ